jgi:hypothetical protein
MRTHLILAGAIVIVGFSLFSCMPQPTPVIVSSPLPEATFTLFPEQVSPTPAKGTVTGIVLESNNAPVSAATVRIQATNNQTMTDDRGYFELYGLADGASVTVSAWKEGYYCANVQSAAPANNLMLVLRSVQTNDNPDYQWVPPTGANSCYSCKSGVTQVWLDNDAHGKSAQNNRFLTMYNGTDVNGNQSPLTRFTQSRDYGRLPIPPDLTKPYFGPGYKLDFPDTSGNCAACHIPGAAIAEPYGVDPNRVSGIDQFGIHCDFCHKIADVRLDPATQLPDADMPGVLSMDIRRPFPEDKSRYQLFFGTFDDDNVPMEDTYLPLIKQSQFCAPCHYGVFWDTVVYNSYGEWLASPYSNPNTGRTCQDCHMPAPTLMDGKPLTNVAPGKGGVERDPATIHAHTFPGAASQELLQNALTMKVTAGREGGRLVVQVTLTNDKTGHDIPTDSPLRQMILLVEARDSQGKALEMVEGERVPDWGGTGDPAKGYYAGLPGKGFARILAELWTELSPTGAYWNPTRQISDNRLAAFASDTSRYAFSPLPQAGSQVKVQLWYRRAFRSLADRKGWNIPDSLMAEQTVAVP